MLDLATPTVFGADADRRIQLLVRFGYDGARFFGLQPQPGLLTAGGALRQRFVDAGLTPKALCFSSRTDRGVHALENLATLWLAGPLAKPEALSQILEARADGLTVHEVRRVPKNVHARGIVIAKHYRYVVEDGWADGEQDCPSAWRICPRLDPERIRAAVPHLVGDHDYSSLRGGPQNVGDPCKRIDRIELTVEAHPGHLETRIDVFGRSFLRHMVRNLATLLVEVGTGWRPVEGVAELLAARDRRLLGPTAPPGGLTLMSVRHRLDAPQWS